MCLLNVRKIFFTKMFIVVKILFFWCWLSGLKVTAFSEITTFLSCHFSHLVICSFEIQLVVCLMTSKLESTFV